MKIIFLLLNTMIVLFITAFDLLPLSHHLKLGNTNIDETANINDETTAQGPTASSQSVQTPIILSADTTRKKTEGNCKSEEAKDFLLKEQN